MQSKSGAIVKLYSTSFAGSFGLFVGRKARNAGRNL
jgi:hypothetical protein